VDRDTKQLRREITQLIQSQIDDLQIDDLEKETFGGATEAEHREYEQRQKRIDELDGKLYRLNAAA
jgi:hypothetical protein